MIPMAEMLSNNAFTGIAPAVNMLVEQLDIRKDHVSMLLSFGATRSNTSNMGTGGMERLCCAFHTAHPRARIHVAEVGRIPVCEPSRPQQNFQNSWRKTAIWS